MASELLKEMLAGAEVSAQLLQAIRREIDALARSKILKPITWDQAARACFALNVVSQLESSASSELEQGDDGDHVGEALLACLKAFDRAGALFGEGPCVFRQPKILPPAVQAAVDGLAACRQAGDLRGALSALLRLRAAYPQKAIISQLIEDVVCRGWFLGDGHITLVHSRADVEIGWESWLSYVADALSGSAPVRVHHWRLVGPRSRPIVLVRADLPRHLHRVARACRDGADSPSGPALGPGLPR